MALFQCQHATSELSTKISFCIVALCLGNRLRTQTRAVSSLRSKVSSMRDLRTLTTGHSTMSTRSIPCVSAIESFQYRRESWHIATTQAGMWRAKTRQGSVKKMDYFRPEPRVRGSDEVLDQISQGPASPCNMHLCLRKVAANVHTPPPHDE